MNGDLKETLKNNSGIKALPIPVKEENEQERINRMVKEKNLKHIYGLRDTLEFDGHPPLTAVILTAVLRNLKSQDLKNIEFSLPIRGTATTLHSSATSVDELRLDIIEYYDKVKQGYTGKTLKAYLRAMKRYVEKATAPVINTKKMKEDIVTQRKAYNIRPVAKEGKTIEDTKGLTLVKTEPIKCGSIEEILNSARETVKLINAYENNCKDLAEKVSLVDLEKNDFMHSLELMALGELDNNKIDMKLGKDILTKRRLLHNALDDLAEVIELKRLIRSTIQNIYLRDQKLYGVRSEMFKNILGTDRLIKEKKEK